MLFAIDTPPGSIRGILLSPIQLAHPSCNEKVAVKCPEAFHALAGALVPVCPTVPFCAFFMTTFISLAISDTMFPDEAQLRKQQVSAGYIKTLFMTSEPVVSALNPSHASTIDVIRRKFDLDLPIPDPIPDRAPKVQLRPGDELIVLQAQLPRLAEGEVHSAETVENARIKFSLWHVM